MSKPAPIPVGVLAHPALYDLAAWVGVLAIRHWLERRTPQPCPVCKEFTHMEGSDCIAIPLIVFILTDRELSRPPAPDALARAQERGRRTRQALEGKKPAPKD